MERDHAGECGDLFEAVSSTRRQKTEMMKVLRSKREDRLNAGWFGRYQA